MPQGSNTMFVQNQNLNLQSIELRLASPLKNTRLTVNKLNKRPDGLNYLKEKTYRYLEVIKYLKLDLH